MRFENGDLLGRTNGHEFNEGNFIRRQLGQLAVVLHAHKSLFFCPRISRIDTNAMRFENGDLLGRTNGHEFNEGNFIRRQLGQLAVVLHVHKSFFSCPRISRIDTNAMRVGNGDLLGRTN